MFTFAGASSILSPQCLTFMPVLCICVKFNAQNVELAYYINDIILINLYLLIITFLTDRK